MESFYRESFTLSDLHLDCHRRLKPSVLLYFVQEVSSKHAAMLGSDWETLADKNLFWAIIRHKVQITRMPEAGETITLETWPMPTTRVAYPRATVAYDENGNELFRTVALWVLMDLQTRAMVLPGKSGVIVNGLIRGKELDIPPSILPKTLENHVVRTVGYTELDRNGHMNNTRYLDWVDDLLPAAFHQDHPMKEILLCYLTEAREGQQIRLFWNHNEAGELSVDALRTDENNPEKSHRIFAAKVTF